MIEIENVKMSYPVPKRYVEYLYKPFHTAYHTALENINLKIYPGDRVAFLGVNGAGKTSLLKLISGLLYPTEGKIIVNGFDTVSDNRHARINVGFALNEERSFYWRLTGWQNLEFFGALDDLFGETLKQRINHVLKLVGLHEHKDKLFAGYSSGMRQRLAIARGLLNDSQVLILDEPTRTLDPQSVDSIVAILKEKIHHERARTLLIATHRFDEAQQLCNRVCIMKKGRIIFCEPLDIVQERYGNIENCYRSLMTSNDIQTYEELSTENACLY